VSHYVRGETGIIIIITYLHTTSSAVGRHILDLAATPSSCFVTEKLTVTQILRKFQRFLWHQEVDCRIEKRQQLVPILSQFHPVHNPRPLSLRSTLTSSYHLCLGLLSDLAFSFSTRFLYTFLIFHSYHVP
jgi:hypothetical protein